MLKNVGLKDYFLSAFNAKPAGMFISPNWIGLSSIALLGILLNPGFLLLGAGLECAYLISLINNSRFRKYVQGIGLSQDATIRQKQFQVIVDMLYLTRRLVSRGCNDDVILYWNFIRKV